MSGGSLLEVGCPSSLTRETQQQVSFTTTLGGKRKAFIRRGGRRTWSVDVSVARPGEVSTLEAVTRNLGPVGWYPPEAVVGNLLSPQASGFGPGSTDATDAGLVQLPDGTVARSVASDSAVRPGNAHGSYEMVPLRPGQSVTVGCWSVGGQHFRGFWRDGTGASITNWSVSATSWAGWGWYEATLTPPAGAAFIELHVAGGSQYALPSVSWGGTARAELGTGCPRAVIHSPSHSPVALWQGANYTNSSYSVTEVG